MARSGELEEVLGVRFRDAGLLRLALVHSSFLNENPGGALESNERLEYLGDAVLGMAVAEELYAANLGWPEGKLTQARAALVQEGTLAEAARDIGLGEMLHMGRGEEDGGGRDRPSNLSAGLEAVIGAVFLDRGYDVARDVVLRVLGDRFSSLGEPEMSANPKSALQEAVQAEGLASPAYRIVHEEGADHDRLFVAEVTVGGEVAGRGEGKRKSLAEQAAAVEALRGLVQTQKAH